MESNEKEEKTIDELLREATAANHVLDVTTPQQRFDMALQSYILNSRRKGQTKRQIKRAVKQKLGIHITL